MLFNTWNEAKNSSVSISLPLGPMILPAPPEVKPDTSKVVYLVQPEALTPATVVNTVVPADNVVKLTCLKPEVVLVVNSW